MLRCRFPRRTLGSGRYALSPRRGPGQTELLGHRENGHIDIQNSPVPVRVAVAADLARITKEASVFVRDLMLSLALLAAALAAATWVQIGLGLRPLARVREGIAAIRTGRAG